ncbi:glycoside hydrolase family 43 protein [Dyadobacter psychrotolerans]
MIQINNCFAAALSLIVAVSGQSAAQKTPGKIGPLVTDLYTADPSAHVFNGKIYIYPSHDVEADVPQDDEGGHFQMRDYHVYSLDKIGGKVTDHGVALDVKDVPWADKQMWAPDAAYKNGTYLLYFPAKDKEGIFRIGVATSKSPTGPFKAEPKPIAGSYSIDPAVFTDTDGKAYMYLGGIWGGQLQRWHTGTYKKALMTDLGKGHENEPALGAKVAVMKDNMLSFGEPLRDVQILDENGKPLLASDTNRRFFEGAWMHKYNGKYYFSYSTGDTHLLCYAEGNSPYGPFTYKGVIMNPVEGWTTHHSIVEVKGKWYLFYHDSELSGKTHLRNVKVRELIRDSSGNITTINP